MFQCSYFCFEDWWARRGWGFNKDTQNHPAGRRLSGCHFRLLEIFVWTLQLIGPLWNRHVQTNDRTKSGVILLPLLNVPVLCLTMYLQKSDLWIQYLYQLNEEELYNVCLCLVSIWCDYTASDECNHLGIMRDYSQVRMTADFPFPPIMQNGVKGSPGRCKTSTTRVRQIPVEHSLFMATQSWEEVWSVQTTVWVKQWCVGPLRLAM